MKKVYISGPYTSPDPARNVSDAMNCWHMLFSLGFMPFIPHLCHFLHIHQPREYDDWLRWDLEWLWACDVLLRMPGESPGADREVTAAKEIGIPVFYSIGDLLDWVADG